MTDSELKPIDSADIKRGFGEDGFFFPLEAITPASAQAYRAEFESLEDSIQAAICARQGQLNHMHLVLRFVNEIARNDRILDAVESLIGPNILVWDSTFFIKPPRSQEYVSWHQDLRYWGLEDPHAMVSAWLALGPVNTLNGCMQFVRKSHAQGLIAHKDRFDVDNSLYRGQEAQIDIDQREVVDVELEPGRFSLHHGYLLHSSPANPSNIRRWGLTINYIAPHNKQVVAERDFAMQVRGKDAYGNFEQAPAPESDLSAEALEWHARVIAAKEQAAFQGVDA